MPWDVNALSMLCLAVWGIFSLPIGIGYLYSMKGGE
jgi:hypothetical protein